MEIKRKENKKEKEKEKEGERKSEFRGEPFGGDHDAGQARAAVAAACRGFGRKWRARIEGNRGTEWRLGPGVGTGEKISRVRVQVLGGFELNDENNFENNLVSGLSGKFSGMSHPPTSLSLPKMVCIPNHLQKPQRNWSG